jgi:hypothetical protein
VEPRTIAGDMTLRPTACMSHARTHRSIPNKYNLFRVAPNKTNTTKRTRMFNPPRPLPSIHPKPKQTKDAWSRFRRRRKLIHNTRRNQSMPTETDYLLHRERLAGEEGAPPPCALLALVSSGQPTLASLPPVQANSSGVAHPHLTSPPHPPPPPPSPPQAQVTSHAHTARGLWHLASTYRAIESRFLKLVWILREGKDVETEAAAIGKQPKQGGPVIKTSGVTQHVPSNALWAAVHAFWYFNQYKLRVWRYLFN